jgi:hypothetical protein
MVPELRAAPLKQIATRVLNDFEGDLNEVHHGLCLDILGMLRYVYLSNV